MVWARWPQNGYFLLIRKSCLGNLITVVSTVRDSLLGIWSLSDPLNKNLWTMWGKSPSHMFSCKGQDGKLRCRAKGLGLVSYYVLALKRNVVISETDWEVFFLIFELVSVASFLKIVLTRSRRITFSTENTGRIWVVCSIHYSMYIFNL